MYNNVSTELLKLAKEFEYTTKEIKEALADIDDLTDEDYKLYLKHAMLNLGQAWIDLEEVMHSKNADDFKLLRENLFYAILPPSLHHNGKELKSVDKNTLLELFEAGINPDAPLKE